MPRFVMSVPGEVCTDVLDIDCRLKQFIHQFSQETRDIPLGAEDEQKGASIYNWHSYFLRRLCGAMGWGVPTLDVHSRAVQEHARLQTAVRRYLTAMHERAPGADVVAALDELSLELEAEAERDTEVHDG